MAQPQKGAQQCQLQAPGKAKIPVRRGLPLGGLGVWSRKAKPFRAPSGPCACPGRGRPPGGPEPESPLPSPHLSFPRRSTTSTKWQSASPRAEMRRGWRDGLGVPTPPAVNRDRAGGGQRGGHVPSAAALPRPPGPGLRTAASLPVKVSPGPSGRTRRREGRGRGRRRDLTPSLREGGHRGAAGPRPAPPPRLPRTARSGDPAQGRRGEGWVGEGG